MTESGRNERPLPTVQVNYLTVDVGPGAWTRVTAFDSSAEWFDARYALNKFNIECLMDAVSQPGVIVLLVQDAEVPQARQILGLVQASAAVPAITIEDQPKPVIALPDYGTPAKAENGCGGLILLFVLWVGLIGIVLLIILAIFGAFYL